MTFLVKSAYLRILSTLLLSFAQQLNCPKSVKQEKKEKKEVLPPIV